MPIRYRPLPGTSTMPIRYRIQPFDPAAHLFRVEVLISGEILDQRRLVVSLPAWIQGSYMIRDFARHVLRLSAWPTSTSKPLPVRKTAKAHWEIDLDPAQPPGSHESHAESAESAESANPTPPTPHPPGTATPAKEVLCIEAEIYAWDRSVRAAHLDQRHGFFNPTSLCLRIVDFDHLPCEVELVAPDPLKVIGNWQVATTLTRVPDGADPRGFGLHNARHYADLADHPVEMGTFARYRFWACGVPHDVVVTGQHRCDPDRLCHDLRRVCEAQIRLFEKDGKAPFERYLFLVSAVDDGYGGLEHHNSTALLCRRSDLPVPGTLARDANGSPIEVQADAPKGYRRFLGLASHEYFHAWHVKRIRPQAFVHHDPDRENYSRLLWIFEGFTSYYDDLMLLRAGVITAKAYLQSLEDTINQVLTRPSRHVQSLSDASFDAWIKYYRQDENAPNAVLSYYTKGALVALCIDLLIHEESAGRQSLDEVMRALWSCFGRGEGLPGAAPAAAASGLSETGFTPLLLEACGIHDPQARLRIAERIRVWTEDTSELPLQAALARVGVCMKSEPACLTLGMQTAARGTELHVKAVLRHSAAQRGGISAGDQLVAIQGLKASEETLKESLSRYSGPLEVLVFRRDELLRLEVQPLENEHPEARLSFAEGDGEQRWIRFARRMDCSTAQPSTQ
ncbi:MAG: M61 family metallopeptidase [Betaproteobacteria bacterium]|nr:M61 family metallopeptidase [Betaproteobacteria bacterium]